MRCLLPWLGIVALYLVIRAPLLDVPLDRNEGACGSIAQAMSRGEMLYRDIFNHKPPGVYIVYSLALNFVPATARGVNGFLLAWNFAALLVLASLARSLFNAKIARWSALTYCIASAAPSVQGFTCSNEMVLALPMVASMRIAVAGNRATGVPHALLLLFSGALAAFAAWTKQPAAIALLAVPACLLIRDGWRRELRDWIVWGVGGVLATPAILAPYAVAGVLDELWYWSFVHNTLYGDLSWHAGVGRGLRAVEELSQDLLVPALCAVLGCRYSVRARDRGSWFPAVFMGLSVVSATHSGFFYLHYFALLVPSLAIAAGLGMAWLQEVSSREPVRTGIAMALVAASIAAPIFLRPWYWVRPDAGEVSIRMHGPQGFGASAEIAEYIRQSTTSDEAIYVHGSESQIAFLSGRRNLNVFVMAYPLTHPWPRHREFQERVWSELEAQPPAYIVVALLRPSQLASSERDPFLDDRVSGLLGSSYRLAGLVSWEANDGYHIQWGDGPGPGIPDGHHPIHEIWRRRTRDR